MLYINILFIISVSDSVPEIGEVVPTVSEPKTMPEPEDAVKMECDVPKVTLKRTFFNKFFFCKF